jgi:hypothetical protein
MRAGHGKNRCVVPAVYGVDRWGLQLWKPIPEHVQGRFQGGEEKLVSPDGVRV